MFKKIFVTAVVLLIFVYGTMVYETRRIQVHPFFRGEDIQAIAHRGGMGLWPENTLYAFRKSVELDVDILEMDIRSTADGTLVALHDPDADRTTNGMGPVLGMSLEELQGLDAGYRWTNDQGKTFPFRGQGVKVPTLEEVLEAFPRAKLSIEIKQFDPPIVEPLCQMLFRRAKTTLVGSFDDGTIREFRKACPEMATSAGKKEATWFYMLSWAYMSPIWAPTTQALQVPEYSDGRHIATARFVRTAQKRNMFVHIWTVNKEEDMQRMIKLGVNGIITDYPDRLLSKLGR